MGQQWSDFAESCHCSEGRRGPTPPVVGVSLHGPAMSTWNDPVAPAIPAVTAVAAPKPQP